MTNLLLLFLGLLLLGGLGLAVTAGLERLATEHRRRHMRAEALAADLQLQRLTHTAMLQMLDEARRAQPGSWR